MVRDKDELLLTILENSDKIMETATKVGVAYVGYRANNHWSGALTGLIALKLAEAQNLASGIAGVATLTYLGLMNVNAARAATTKPSIYQGIPVEYQHYFAGRTG